MENTDIPQFRTYRGEIELEGVVIQVDVFVDNEMLEDRNSFLISFLCKSNTIYEMICRNISKSKEYYVILKFNGVKSKLRILSVSQSFIGSFILGTGEISDRVFNYLVDASKNSFYTLSDEMSEFFEKNHYFKKSDFDIQDFSVEIFRYFINEGVIVIHEDN